MKHNKHFRKDVIIARVIFCVTCVIVLGFVTSGVDTLVKKIKDSETEDLVSESIISESETEPNFSIETQSGLETQTESESESESETQTNSELETQQETQTQSELQTQTELESESESESEADIKPNDLYVVATVNIKLRQAPSTESEAIVTIPGGNQALFLDELEGWYKVRYQGKEGFISAEFAQKRFTQQELQELRDWEARQLELSMKTMIMIDPTGEQLVFDIVDLLKKELENRDYLVKITRKPDETNVTAQQRAQIATQADADIMLGIYMGNAQDTSLSGAMAFAPSSANTSVSELAPNCQRLSQEIMNAYCTQTGMGNDGIIIDDTKEELNYASMPTAMISLGYISNPSDSSNMQDSEYQRKMVQAIADGIDAYFAQQ